MPRNGSGTYAAAASSWNPAVADTEIDEVDWIALLADITATFSASIASDGQTVCLAAIPFAAGLTATTGVFSSTLTPQALIDASGASAGQIKFPATQNASANANTLDDYEEGTWTPVVGGSATYSLQTATYTKIGELVRIRMDFQINSIGSGSATTVTGVPFVAASGRHALAVENFNASLTSVTWLGAYVINGTTIKFTGTAASTASASDVVAVFQNSTRVGLAGVFHL